MAPSKSVIYLCLQVLKLMLVLRESARRIKLIRANQRSAQTPSQTKNLKRKKGKIKTKYQYSQRKK